MDKTKSIIPVVVGIIILSAMSFENDVYGPTEELFGNYNIKAKKVDLVCTELGPVTPGSCGTGQMKAKLTLNLTDELSNGTIIGDGNVVLKITAEDDWETPVAFKVNIQNVGVTYYPFSQEIAMEEITLVLSDGNTLAVEITGDNITSLGHNKFTVDLSILMTTPGERITGTTVASIFSFDHDVGEF